MKNLCLWGIIILVTLSGCNNEHKQPHSFSSESKTVVYVSLDSFQQGSTFTSTIEFNGHSFSRAITLAPMFNISPHELQNKSLRQSADSLTGMAAIKIFPDIFNNRKASTQPQWFTLYGRFNNNRLSGRYTLADGRSGVIHGFRKPSLPVPPDVHYHLHLDHLVFQKKNITWQKCANIMLYQTNNQFEFVSLVSDKSKTYTTWTATADLFNLSLRDNQLKGNIYASIAQDDTINKYIIRLESEIIDTVIAGKAFVSMNGIQTDSTLLTGALLQLNTDTIIDPVFTIDLHEGLLNNHILRILAGTKDKKIISAVGLSPSDYSQEITDFSFSNPVLTDNSFTGTATLSLTKKEKSYAFNYNINCLYQNGYLTGTYTGYQGAANQKGIITGTIGHKAKTENIKGYYLHFKDALIGPDPKANRILITITMKDGKPVTKKVFPGQENFPVDAPWEGLLVDQKITVTDQLFNGHLIVDIQSLKVKPGRYHFTIEAQVIGSQLIGRYKCFIEENRDLKKQGKFNGVLQGID